MPSLRDELRALPSIVGQAPDASIERVPATPRELFVSWLHTAMSLGVPEPHAATLSTVDADGLPDARVLILKDVTNDGAFEVATSDDSTKGMQLTGSPKCALSFYWGPLARAVRVRGLAARASDAEATIDFRARNSSARAIALAAQQSSVMPSAAGRDELLRYAESRIAEDPQLVSPHWSLWRIHPETVEFWQGDPSRNHVRVRFRRNGRNENDGWIHERLWA